MSPLACKTPSSGASVPTTSALPHLTSTPLSLRPTSTGSGVVDSESQVACYSLALLELMDKDDGSTTQPPLGIARLLGAESSVLNVPAHRLLKALITHAPSQETIAKEFLVELGKCGNTLVETLAEEVYNEVFTLAINEWAHIVLQELQESGGDVSYVTQLGSHYFSHLVIAFRNPGGKKTPQDSVHPTAQHKRIEEIEELLTNTKNRSQSALKDLVMLRDGNYCLFTGLSYFLPNRVVARCAHIIPFSIHSKTQTYTAIKTFTGSVLDAKTIQDNINDPRNALNLETNTHDSIDKHLAWGIEAISSGDQWKYFYRVVRPGYVPPFTRVKDGDEIHFGTGIGGHLVSLPDPRFCNLHLAVCRVSYACGASKTFDQFVDKEVEEEYFDDEDDDAFQGVPTSMGASLRRYEG